MTDTTRAVDDKIVGQPAGDNNGAATGSGSGAGGGGAAEDYDSDPMGGGGSFNFAKEREAPDEGGDASQHGSR